MSTREGRRGGPEPVGEVLAKYMHSSGLDQKLRSPEVYDCWPEVVGAEVCKHTRVVGFDRCILYVEVDSAPWLQMLATFRKPELLRSLRESMRGVRVRDIRFRIGSLKGPAPDTSGRNQWHKQANPPTPQATSRSYPA